MLRVALMVGPPLPEKRSIGNTKTGIPCPGDIADLGVVRNNGGISG